MHVGCSTSKESFNLQVAKETEQAEGTRVEYSGVLFQPVPWSPTTKKGMPQEFEKYHADPDYVMINIPPNFMFKVHAAADIMLRVLARGLAGSHSAGSQISMLCNLECAIQPPQEKTPSSWCRRRRSSSPPDSVPSTGRSECAQRA